MAKIIGKNIIISGAHTSIDVDTGGEVNVTVNENVSASSGSFSTSSNSFVNVTGVSVTITTVGRPVMVGFQNDGSGNPALIQTAGSSGAQSANLRILRDGIEISQLEVLIDAADGPGSIISAFWPVTGANILDTGATAGSHTYTAQMKSFGTGGGTTLQNAVLFAYEI
jgi:hypothetical protein